MLNTIIGNYSGITKLSFGILIILIHRFTLYNIHTNKMRKSEKGNNSATHTFGIQIVCSSNDSKTHYTHF